MSSENIHDSKLLQQLHNLHQELLDGDITQKGHDKRKAAIMALHEKKHKKKGPKLYAPPLFKATVTETADAAMKVTASTADIDDAILATIKKCLDRANHPETPESEAKAALYLATRRMKQYNISQAEVLAHQSPEDRRNYQGHSTVAITRRDGDLSKEVFQHVFLNALMDAMDRFFDVKSLTVEYTCRTRFCITFYGLANNSAAAALAFEMVYNLIGEWGRRFKGLPAKNSYCMGVCRGLRQKAVKEKEDEEARAIKAEKEALAARVKEEQAQRQAELDRLAAQSSLDEGPIDVVEDGVENAAEHDLPRPAGTDGQYNTTVEDDDEDMADQPDANDRDNASVRIADDGDEWNGFGDDEVETDADQRTILFRKTMKRIATCVFEDGVARRTSLVNAINDELEGCPELGQCFEDSDEVNRILERLVTLDVFEENYSNSHVKLTDWMRRELCQDSSDSGVDGDTPMSGNDQNEDDGDDLQDEYDDIPLGTDNDDYIDADFDADFDEDSEPPPPETNLSSGALNIDFSDAVNGFLGNSSQSQGEVNARQSEDNPTTQPRNSSPAPTVQGPEVSTEDPQWASHMQLVTFRETAKKIAEEYREKTWGKLRQGRFRSMKTVDQEAMKAGKGDAHKIDVHRKTITD